MLKQMVLFVLQFESGLCSEVPRAHLALNLIMFAEQKKKPLLHPSCFASTMATMNVEMVFASVVAKTRAMAMPTTRTTMMMMMMTMANEDE